MTLPFLPHLSLLKPAMFVGARICRGHARVRVALCTERRTVEEARTQDDGRGDMQLVIAGAEVVFVVVDSQCDCSGRSDTASMRATNIVGWARRMPIAA